MGGLRSKAADLWRTFPAGIWIVGALALVGLVIAVWFVTEPGRQRQRAVDTEAGRTFGEARTNSATSAIGTVVNNASQAGRIDDRVKGSEDAVRNAPADRRDDVTLRELCKSPSARNRPECRLLDAGP